MTEDRFTYVIGLGRRFPELQDMLDEHESYYEEILPHIFFGELTSWIDAQRNANGPVLRSLLDDLEHAVHTSSDDVQELIAVSFLENLPSESQVWGMLGPELKAEAARMFGDDDSRGRH